MNNSNKIQKQHPTTTSPLKFSNYVPVISSNSSNYQSDKESKLSPVISSNDQSDKGLKKGPCGECKKITTKQYPTPNCGAFYCSDWCWSK